MFPSETGSKEENIFMVLKSNDDWSFKNVISKCDHIFILLVFVIL